MRVYKSHLMQNRMKASLHCLLIHIRVGVDFDVVRNELEDGEEKLYINNNEIRELAVKLLDFNKLCMARVAYVQLARSLRINGTAIL